MLTFMKHRTPREKLILRLSCAVGFVIFCALCYEMSLSSYSKEYERLGGILKQLEDDKTKAIALNSQLHLHLNSQSDPDWIELTLIEGLGLCPEGQQKVVFIKDTP